MFFDIMCHMDARSEIDAAVKGMCKRGQPLAIGRHLSGDPDVDAYVDLYNNRLIRGVAKGIRDAIPGMVEYIPASSAGIASLAMGNGFNAGYDGWRKFVAPLTDACRRLSMKLGGRHVKRLLDERFIDLKGRAPGYDDRADRYARNMANAADYMTQLAVSPYGKFSKAVKAVPRAVSAAPKIGPMASKALEFLAKPMTSATAAVATPIAGELADGVRYGLTSKDDGR